MLLKLFWVEKTLPKTFSWKGADFFFVRTEAKLIYLFLRKTNKHQTRIENQQQHAKGQKPTGKIASLTSTDDSSQAGIASEWATELENLGT